MTKSTTDNSLDAVLAQVGDFGKYQIYIFVLVWIPTIMHSAVHVAYVFTAMDLTYRCEIPECDSNKPQYETSWLVNAVPYTDGIPEKCEMYTYNSTEINTGNCSSSNFANQETVRCSSFVYKTHEQSILQEYNLQCSDNLWKLTLVGTINSFGQFSGLFIAGSLADIYGRRVVMVWGMVLCAVCGLIRTLMPTYEWFMVLEYLDAFFSSCTYISGFVLAVELVGPKKRALTGTVACSANALGSIITATAAWNLKSWKSLIYVLYTPAFLLVSYFWIVPESIRWNIKKGRLDEAKATLRKLARVNGKEIEEKTLDQLNVTENEPAGGKGQFIQAMKSVTLFMRFITCCFCWVTCSFLFYGLSLNSVTLASGNRYLNFLLTATVEIPALFFCNFCLSYFGRRRSMCIFFFITGASCTAFIFIPSGISGNGGWRHRHILLLPDETVVSLSAYLIGKFGATAAFTGIYVYTSEMFPTATRQSFMGACSTFSRLGIMVAPQMPLLANIWNPLPIVCFSVMALIACGLTLFLPETLNVKLPDTIAEAESMSKLLKK
ncbi:hypothetical protein NQ318_000555 [Aromia moschata]|uniref:Major facilitator superfamily (MFS) profile domain-containing protein n=1 Tax=Aromia moschata TaxID=1265417 RepID=A0AAV8XWB3_9CUCU|nr:hypothetical protein NQ318_000555 [Aromia moschata]